jgi:hypothetical protein
MDTTITSAPESAGATETIQPEQTAGAGSVAPETNVSEGGSSTETTEGGQGQVDGGRKRWSIQDEVRELRAQRRELREQLSSFGTMRDEMAALREELNRRGQPGTAKTPTNFWQDPEGHLQTLRDELKQQNEGLMEAFHQTREQEYAQQALKQERASAVEFIQSQKGYDPSDDEDLIEIIEGIPGFKNLSPSFVAEHAWLKLQQQRGVGDRTALKARASSVQGQPPGTGFGRKTWNKAEYDQAVDLVEQTMRKNPNDPKMDELFNELMSAHKEGRVK